MIPAPTHWLRVGLGPDNLCSTKASRFNMTVGPTKPRIRPTAPHT